MYYASAVYQVSQKKAYIHVSLFGKTQTLVRRFLPTRKTPWRRKLWINSKQININWSTKQDCCTYECDMASPGLCLSQPTTQPKRTNQQPNPNTTLLRIIIANIYKAAQEIRPSRWVSKSWNRYFWAVVKELPWAFCFVFSLIVELKNYILFFLSRTHTICITYILPVGNIPGILQPHSAPEPCVLPLCSLS